MPSKSKAKIRQYYKDNKTTLDEYNKAWNRNKRLSLIQEFGGRCVVCGESDPVVLDFDHINNDGHLDRTKKKIIFRVMDNPERFQLLCKNCNWRKEYWRRQDAK